MTDSRLVKAPAGFIPEQAVSFTDGTGAATRVSGAAPLPVATAMAAATSAPLAGTTAASATVGPFAPQLGRPIWVTLGGSWTGKVQALRSTDGGATLVPLTLGGQEWASFTANANEPIGEESVAGATYYLALTIASGALAYRVAQ